MRHSRNGWGMRGRVAVVGVASAGAVLLLGQAAGAMPAWDASERAVLRPAVFAPAAVTPSATLPTNCTLGSDLLTVTCTYAYTGAEQSFTVPTGVTSVTVRAVGAAGASGTDPGGRDGYGGHGGLVAGTVSVPAGAPTLFVEVGGTPTNSGCYVIVNCVGGFNGGGNGGHFAGGGGGASDVRTVSTAGAGSDVSRLLVAGGGGGAGTLGICIEGGTAKGGDGGGAGESGGPGAFCPGGAGSATGAQPGTSTSGGEGGTTTVTGGATAHGASATTATGANAPDKYTGAGGGGYYGGGSGAPSVPDGENQTSAGGGGGGSSYPAADVVGTTTDPASVTISYALLPIPVTPVVTTNPSDQTVSAGQTASFSAAASGVPSPTVQWQRSTDGGKSFANVAGATSASYTTPSTVAADDGQQFRAVFTNSASSATTSAATLTVQYAPAFTTPAGPLPAGTVGQPYSTTISDTGKPAPTDTLSSGQLPPGLTLTGDPVLSGMATAAGTYTFTITASNSVGSASRTYSITIAPAAVTPPSTPPAAPAPPAPAPAPAPTSETLPFTGFGAAGLTMLGIALVGGGLGARFLGRRRRI